MLRHYTGYTQHELTWEIPYATAWLEAMAHLKNVSEGRYGSPRI